MKEAKRALSKGAQANHPGATPRAEKKGGARATAKAPTSSGKRAAASAVEPSRSAAPKPPRAGKDSKRKGPARSAETSKRPAGSTKVPSIAEPAPASNEITEPNTQPRGRPEVTSAVAANEETATSAPPRAEPHVPSAATPARPAVGPAEADPTRAAEDLHDAPAPSRALPFGLGDAGLASTALTLGRTFVSRAASSSALHGFKNTATGVLRAMQTALGTAGANRLDDYGKDPELERELSPIASFFYDTYWRVQVEGAEHLPSGPSIIVANHSGAMPFDGPVLHAAIRRSRPELSEPRWLIEDQLFYAPFLGTLLNRLGAVRANPENALRLLSEGRPVIVFPEGLQGISKPFSERYRLMRFGRGGFVKLALRARVPIVPVAIVGAEESSPLVARVPAKFLGLPWFPITPPVPLPARWRIRVGEPLELDELPADGREDLLRVNRLNERTRETIQGMLEAMLKSRTGVFS